MTPKTQPWETENNDNPLDDLAQISQAIESGWWGPCACQQGAPECNCPDSSCGCDA